ncbi:MAG TPA: hypothetical protein VNN08_21400 [Thermoanaerobaculia bacterium]|nr:hypothetical protein [Thermoanaerobaculia bacterium]
MCTRPSPAIAILAILFAASLSASTRLVTTGGTDAGDCTVTPCATLSYAIGQAVTDDTVSVGPGTFSNGGAAIVVSKSLHVTGAQAGVDARTRVAPESILTEPARLAADGVVLDGFTITCGMCNPPPCGAGCGIGVFTSSSFSGYAVVNNIITGNPVGVTFGSSGALTSNLLTNNIFDNNVVFLGGPGSYGIFTSAAVTNAVVGGNRFSGQSFGQIDFIGTPSPATVTISGNDFPLGSTDGPAVILINNTGTIITGNTVTGGSAFFGVQFFVGGDDHNISIINNGVIGTPGAILITELIGLGPNGLVTVNSNTFLNNQVGVNVGNPPGVPIEMHFNRIANNATALITSSASAAVNGQNNWWGCNAGPATCATNSISAGSAVILDPWILMNIAAAPSTVHLFQSSLVTVDFNHNSLGAAISGFPNSVLPFSATGGNLSQPPFSPIFLGMSLMPFTATAVGPATVSATLDAQTVTANITVTGPIPAVPPMMLALLAAVLGSIALFMMRKIVD